MSQSIADVVLTEAAREQAKKVLVVEIEIGELSLLSIEQVEFCLGLCFENTIASDARLVLRSIRPEIECLNCGFAGEPEDQADPSLPHFRLPLPTCPRCASAEIKIRRGRECTVKKIEVLA